MWMENSFHAQWDFQDFSTHSLLERRPKKEIEIHKPTIQKNVQIRSIEMFHFENFNYFVLILIFKNVLTLFSIHLLKFQKESCFKF